MIQRLAVDKYFNEQTFSDLVVVVYGGFRCKLDAKSFELN